MQTRSPSREALAIVATCALAVTTFAQEAPERPRFAPPPGPQVADFNDDVVPWVESHCRVHPDRAHRALAGLSMGGGQMLRKHGFEVAFEETDAGHTWKNWREYLVAFAPQLFR